jgi:hypothetical protein
MRCDLTEKPVGSEGLLFSEAKFELQSDDTKQRSGREGGHNCKIDKRSTRQPACSYPVERVPK